MNSTPNPKATDADDILIARADERLAHAYSKIASADEQLARVTEKLSRLEYDAPRHPSVLLGRGPSRGRVVRGLIGFLLPACIFVGAFLSQSSYGDTAKAIIAPWVPRLMSASPVALEKPGLAEQSSPIAVQVAAAEAIAPQPTASAQTAPQHVVPTAALMSPELTQLLGTITRGLADVEHRIEELKTSQEQMASDNAKIVEQLKASHEKMMRVMARAPEQNLPHKTLAAAPRPIATPTTKPMPTLPSAQAKGHLQAPMQLQPKSQ